MNIELLYFDGCPNWTTVRDELNGVIAELGLHETITLVRVPDDRAAGQAQFLGSPTVRVNGSDVDPNAAGTGYMLGCRLYWVNGKLLGSPPREWLVTAIRHAQGRYI